MFGFFVKKDYLVSQLNGFVDIHNHILPEIDDGARNVQDSLDIIKGFSQFGVKNFICTPHIINNYFDNTPKTIQAAHRKLKLALQKARMNNIVLDFAAEHMIDYSFEDLLDKKMVLPLKNRHLLVEMSFLQAPINLNRSIEKTIINGFFPVLAHPERYGFLHKNFGKYHALKQMGVLFQVNLLSLTGFYGSDVKNIALKLIDKGMVDFLASDVHNTYQLGFIKECTISKDTVEKIHPLITNTIETFW